MIPINDQNPDYITIEDTVDEVIISELGLPGDIGPQGIPGTAGPAGPPGKDGSNANASYIHSQNTPSDTWTVNHNLNFYPSIAIVDSAENIVEGEVTYINQNSLIVKFTFAFGGMAYLS